MYVNQASCIRVLLTLIGTFVITACSTPGDESTAEPMTSSKDAIYPGTVSGDTEDHGDIGDGTASDAEERDGAAVVPFQPPDPPDTSAIVLASCNNRFADEVWPAEDRPSSLTLCDPDPYMQESRCLPWEFCRNGPQTPCVRSCVIQNGDVDCSPGATCIMGFIGDNREAIGHCEGGEEGRVYPDYVAGPPFPSEGGLGCWTPHSEGVDLNSGSSMTVMDGYIYLISGAVGIPVGREEFVGRQRIQRAPLRGTPETTAWETLLDEPNAPVVRGGVLRSGDRFVALEVDVESLSKEGVQSDYNAPPTKVSLGTIAGDGSVSWQATDYELPGFPGYTSLVASSRHACYAKTVFAELNLYCFVMTGGELVEHHASFPLHPAMLLDAQGSLAASPMIAASDTWFAIRPGPTPFSPTTWGLYEDYYELYYARVDPSTGLPADDWRRQRLGLEITDFRSLLLYESTALYGEVISYLHDDPAENVVVSATLRDPNNGSAAALAQHGDLILSKNFLARAAPEVPFRLMINRFVW